MLLLAIVPRQALCNKGAVQNSRLSCPGLHCILANHKPDTELHLWRDQQRNRDPSKPAGVDATTIWQGPRRLP